jgi:hypothetical protein
MTKIIIKNYNNYKIKITDNSILVSCDKKTNPFIIDFLNGDMIITSENKDFIKNNQNNQDDTSIMKTMNIMNNENKKLIYEWEEEKNINIGHCDDFEKMPKTKTIDEVKKRCIELGSHLFIQKPGNQYYIRSPPNVKKNRDYNSIKLKAEELRKRGKIHIGVVSYILKPII